MIAVRYTPLLKIETLKFNILLASTIKSIEETNDKGTGKIRLNNFWDGKEFPEGVFFVFEN